LLRTRRGGRLAPTPPSLAGFDHAIAYVPSLDLFLDGTAEFSGVDELPNQDQGVTVLRVGAHGVRLTQTPVLPSSRNRAVRTLTAALSADGGARVHEDLKVTGQAAAEWRQHYQTVGEQAERYGKVWSGRYPGARLSSVKMPDLADRNRPVAVAADVDVPKLGDATSAGGWALPLGVREGDLVRNYARLSARRSELLLAYPWQHEERLTYRLPKGFTWDALPPEQHIQTRFGSFEMKVEARDGATVIVHSLLDVSHARIAAADYGDFRNFLSQVDVAMARHLVLRRTSVATSTSVRSEVQAR